MMGVNGNRRCWKRLFCFFGRHKYYVRQRFSDACGQIGCRRCPRLWGVNTRVGGMLPWDVELEFTHIPYTGLALDTRTSIEKETLR